MTIPTIRLPQLQNFQKQVQLAQIRPTVHIGSEPISVPTGSYRFTPVHNGTDHDIKHEKSQNNGNERKLIIKRGVKWIYKNAQGKGVCVICVSIRLYKLQLRPSSVRTLKSRCLVRFQFVNMHHRHRCPWRESHGIINRINLPNNCKRPAVAARPLRGSSLISSGRKHPHQLTRPKFLRFALKS